VTEFSETVWTARGTKPGEIEAALESILVAGTLEHAGYLPARALNMVCVADKSAIGEVADRLRGVGRYHASRTVLCAVEPGRSAIDATAEISYDAAPGAGDVALMREIVRLEVGERHLAHLEPIVDPLVVTDLPTVLWVPQDHPEAVRALLPLAQVMLLDSMDESDPGDGLRRAHELLESVYVVDLAWLRSIPWRERVAATFDPLALRPELYAISAVTVRHNPDSTAAALLLIGWLASRLNWDVEPLARAGGELAGVARAGTQEVRLALEPLAQEVLGLAGVTLETSTGRWLALDRGPGGLRARYRNARGDSRSWTVLGASRGEAGILGEGIRQALLRDPTYGPAVSAACLLVT
jgi:glucose-6-phosphate dehydrogenase assembly protein OpcA